MTEDNKKFINNLYPYFKMLENINKYLNKIRKDNKNNIYEYEDIFYKITSEILRLLPYKKNREGKLILVNNSGILLLKDNIDFLIDKYNKIINCDSLQDVLKDILTIRNKYIHEPHNISYCYSVSATTNLSMGLRYKNEALSISTISLMPIVYHLNKIFNEIKNKAILIIESDNNYKDYPYYKIIKKLDFSNKKNNYIIMPKYLIYDF